MEAEQIARFLRLLVREEWWSAERNAHLRWRVNRRTLRRRGLAVRDDVCRRHRLPIWRWNSLRAHSRRYRQVVTDCRIQLLLAERLPGWLCAFSRSYRRWFWKPARHG